MVDLPGGLRPQPVITSRRGEIADPAPGTSGPVAGCSAARAISSARTDQRPATSSGSTPIPPTRYEPGCTHCSAAPTTTTPPLPLATPCSTTPMQSSPTMPPPTCSGRRTPRVHLLNPLRARTSAPRRQESGSRRTGRRAGQARYERPHHRQCLLVEKRSQMHPPGRAGLYVPSQNAVTRRGRQRRVQGPLRPRRLIGISVYCLATRGSPLFPQVGWPISRELQGGSPSAPRGRFSSFPPLSGTGVGLASVPVAGPVARGRCLGIPALGPLGDPK
jgi:hypothetical protein